MPQQFRNPMIRTGGSHSQKAYMVSNVYVCTTCQQPIKSGTGRMVCPPNQPVQYLCAACFNAAVEEAVNAELDVDGDYDG